MLRTDELRSLFPFALPVVESLGNGFAVVGDGNQRVNCRTLRHGQLDLFGDVGIIHTDDGLHRGTGIAIHDVVLGQHVGGRDDDGTDLMQGEHDHPPLVTALQNQHHRVVLADA